MQGMFLRGFGSQAYTQNNGSTIGLTATTHASGLVGQVQGDAERQLTGKIYTNLWTPMNVSESGPFFFEYRSENQVSANLYSNYGIYTIGIDSSRTVPTANENRPANVAVRYLIRATW